MIWDVSRAHQMRSGVASGRPKAKNTGGVVSLCRTNREKN